MRVISGEKKGLRLKAVPGKGTRPTTDKVREALFNIIGPYFEGGRVLDLFAGSGALSIEALSRGLNDAVLIENDQTALKTIRENLAHAQLQKKASVYRTDAKGALQKLSKNTERFDIIFLDPPYNLNLLPEFLELIDQNQLLSDNGLIVCEHETGLVLPDEAVTFEQIRSQKYGNTSVTIFKRIEAS